MKTKRNHHLIQVSGLLLAASAAGLHAQEQPAPKPEADTSLFGGKIPEAFTKGKFSVNVRLRYEFAEQENLDASNAFTVRPRFGFTTAPVYGFQGMIEAENITALERDDNYNQAGLNPGAAGKTPVLDPETTELNQAWLSYSRWDTTLKGGRQRIVLDNHRFVGDVGWRQNSQTFDAATLESKALKDFNFFYGYVENVNRILGDDHPLGDFDSDSHLFNASYSGWKHGKVVAYSYLLDFSEPSVPAVRGASSATYGLSLTGGHTYDQERNLKVNYRGEFAWQTDYGAQPIDYGAPYFNAELGGEYNIFSLGGGYELLGSDNGKGFSTPLATLHAFNGWADTFAGATPAAGLQDIYGSVGVKLPGGVPLKFIYHKFDSDTGGFDYGQEFDIVASKTFGKHWTALAKYAYHDAKAPYFNIQRFWAQVEFNY